jgi:hypothetical protein
MSQASPPDAACPVCSELPAFVAADLREGERLPAAASRLVDQHPHPEGFWDTVKDYEITKKCPVCGQLYTYSYHYEFSVGYVEESVWLERRTPDSSSPPD